MLLFIQEVVCWALLFVVVVVAGICRSCFVVVVFIVCCVLLLVPSNPRLLFNVWLLVVVAVGVRGLLCVCVCLLFLCVLFDCLFVRFLIIESRSKFVVWFCSLPLILDCCST